MGVGSIAFGTMRPNSDIDAAIFMDPVDHYIVPAESQWVPETNPMEEWNAEHAKRRGKD